MRILHIHEEGPQALQVTALLRAMSFAVDEAASVDEGRLTLETNSYDVAFVDVDGVSDQRAAEVEELCRLPGPCQVIVCGSFEALPLVARAMEKGAKDFVLRPLRPAELKIRLLKAAMQEREPTNTRAPTSYRFGPLNLDLVTGEILLDAEPLELTPRERGVLSVMVRSRGNIVDKEQIAARIFRLEDEASARSIETYISRLRRKLKASGVAIETVRGLGYRLTETARAEIAGKPGLI